ncbi:hypothetical protein V496_07243 [Pseudogymnoascus sp. VKM F-4515 (FW-2607)]|nr:hypothetical protein V496_07243 [Pseudogymnoascus sp. VKM F-4515 (FW-2607)]
MYGSARCAAATQLRQVSASTISVSVREKLEKGGNLAAKAILGAEDGSWIAKPEEPPAVGRKSSGIPGIVYNSGQPQVPQIDFRPQVIRHPRTARRDEHQTKSAASNLNSPKSPPTGTLRLGVSK